MTSQVGTESNEHCFVGAAFSTFTTSSDVNGLKCVSGFDTERLVMYGAGALTVDSFILTPQKQTAANLIGFSQLAHRPSKLVNVHLFTATQSNMKHYILYLYY